MKWFPLLLVGLFLPVTFPLPAQQEAKKPSKGTPDHLEGNQEGLDRPYDLWGGKWENDLLVFVRVFEKEEGNKGLREVRIVQQYKLEAGLYFSKRKCKEMPAGYLRAYNFYLRLGIGDDPNVGLIYDEYSDGRMANLVKVQERVEDVDTYDIADAGWQPGHMPVEEARKLVLGSDAGLLGLPTAKLHRTRSAADEVLVDAQLLQEAKNRWVAEGNDPASVTWAALKSLIHADHRVAMRNSADLYGRPFSLGNANEGVKVHPATFALLQESYPNVWGDFAPAASE